jgi:hypothetical protein
MSLSSSEIPPGGVVNIPPSIPSGMLYRVKSISGISKQILKLVPISGQTTVTQGQKKIVKLPPNSLVDLSTFEMNYKGYTQTAGTEVHGLLLEVQALIVVTLSVNDIFHEIAHQLLKI